jgi:hypothetical protein
MNDVFIERRLPEPLTGDGLQAIVGRFDGCREVHRVTWRGSLLSSAADELFCHFQAPDAESVRIATREGPPGRLWPCQVQDAAGVGPEDLERVTAIVVHAFDEPAGFGARQLREVIDLGCFQLHRVRLLRSYLATDGRRMVALYQAPDAESVRLAQRRAGLPADRVLAVRRFSP